MYGKLIKSSPAPASPTGPDAPLLKDGCKCDFCQNDELIRLALTQWWHGDARLGMTATEARESLLARLKQRGIEIRVIPIQRPE